VSGNLADAYEAARRFLRGEITYEQLKTVEDAYWLSTEKERLALPLLAPRGRDSLPGLEDAMTTDRTPYPTQRVGTQESPLLVVQTGHRCGHATRSPEPRRGEWYRVVACIDVGGRCPPCKARQDQRRAERQAGGR
jgi:hypothetical protein